MRYLIGILLAVSLLMNLVLAFSNAGTQRRLSRTREELRVTQGQLAQCALERDQAKGLAEQRLEPFRRVRIIEDMKQALRQW